MNPTNPDKQKPNKRPGHNLEARLNKLMAEGFRRALESDEAIVLYIETVEKRLTNLRNLVYVIAFFVAGLCLSMLFRLFF